MKKRRVRLKKKFKKILLLSIIAICIGVMAYNVIGFVRWNIDRNQLLDEIKEIEEIVDPVEVEDTEEVELINPPEEQVSDYWYYMKLPFTQVNLKELKQMNKDTVGFISVAGTNINYPVVQTKDNDYYLNRSFKKQKNDAGWVFMDYRNNPNFIDSNTVIYGHGRLDTTMFGSLKNILNTSWVNNKDNYVVRYSTEDENLLFQVFAVYTIQAESYYIETSFSNDTEYKTWLDTMIKRSKYDFKTTVNENDKILTLSTCKDSNNNRVVLHAKLIKKDLKTIN